MTKKAAVDQMREYLENTQRLGQINLDDAGWMADGVVNAYLHRDDNQAYLDPTQSQAFTLAWGRYCQRRINAFSISRLDGYSGPEPGPLTEYEFYGFQDAFNAGYLHSTRDSDESDD